VTVRGRLDRRFVDTDRQRIGDYKTGQVDALCNPTQMLKGRSLQVPLYALAAGEPPATIEILALDPLLADDAREVREFSVFKSVGLSNGFGETLDVLVDLRERGIFPLRSGEHCRYCAYTLACRRGHPPTEHREELAADGADYRGLGGKSTKKPLLVNLQGDSGDLGDPGDPGENDE
jgi:hypothetical protein